MSELQSMFPVSETEKADHVERRHAQNDAFMASNNISPEEHTEYDWGQIGEFYITEWRRN